GWVDSPFTLFGSLIVPMMVVGLGIADSFAGERERRTLETLLASRLSDRTILFGKMGAHISEAMQFLILFHLASMTALNLGHWQGEILLYTPGIALANLVLGFLVASLAAGLGVLLSLRASSVQQATQSLMVATMSPFILASFGSVLIGNVLPDSWREAFEAFFRNTIATADFARAFLAIAAILALADLALVVASMARFQRARLMER
nr:ABC transporter permease [Anaerolineae bacterium]NIN98367.1 ABC transporter permease [Anaerolineae bacterium]